MQQIIFSNGVAVDASLVVSVESNQQKIILPGGLGELEHLLEGRPSKLLLRLRDGSTVEINSGGNQLMIRLGEMGT